MWPGLVLALVALMGTRGDEGPPWTPPGPAAPAGSPGHPCGAAALEDLLNRLRVLEGQVRALRSQCGAEGWPQAVTGRTDARRLCSGRGTFEAGRCACACAPGWGGPTCAERLCARACAGGAPCERGRCRCPPGRLGAACDAHECPQGRGGPGCRLEIPSVTLRVVARGHTSFQVAWSQPREPVDSYQVAIVPMDEAEAVTMHDLPGVAGTFEATGLVPGGTYEVSVQARREQHPGAPSTLRLRTLPAQPPPARRVSPPGPPAPAASPAAPSLQTVLQDLGAKLAPYNGTLQQRLESYLRATAFPLRGNQTVPAVARAIVTYLLRRSPAELRERVLHRLRQGPPGSPSHVKPHVTPGVTSEILVSLDGLRDHVDTVVIRYRLVGGPEGAGGELQVPGDVALARIPGLVPGATYHVEVHGVVQGRTSKSYSTQVTTGSDDARESPPGEAPRYGMDVMEGVEPHGTVAEAVAAPAPSQEEPPSQPILGDLTASQVTPTSVQLQWTVPEGSFDSFMVQYKDAQGQPQVVPVDGESRMVTVPNLVPSRRYKFNVYGVWGRKRLGPISTDAVTAPAPPVEEEPPSRPRLGDLTASHVTPTSVQLDWTVLEGSFDSFTVQYKDTQGQPQAMAVDGGSRTVTVPDLVPSRRYKFNLYGVWGRKRIGLISTEAVTAPSPPREEPSSRPQLGDLTASDVTPTSVQLQWMVPEGSFDSFTVQYKDAQGQPQVVPVDRESRTVTVPNLVPSRRYKFNVYGVWGRKRLGPISTDAVTAPAPPEEEEEEPPPQPQLGDLTASQVTPNSIQLDWTVPEGSFDSFMVQYKDAQGQPQVVPVDGESRTVTVPNLVPSRRYKFNLYGVWGRKRLGPVSTDAITATAMEKEKTPSQPQLDELTASHVTPTSVQLHWTVPEGSFDSFTVQYKDTQGQSQTLVVDRESRTVTVSNLEPSQHYKFNLYGVWGRKRLGPISTDAITATLDPPKEEPPSQPQLGDLTASQVTPNSIQLDWTVPEGTFDSFTVQYKDAQGQPQVIPVDGESRTVTMPDLVPSRRYKFNLYGVWGQKRLGPVSTDAVTAPAPPEEKEEEPPSQPLLGDLTASHVTPNSIQLDWTVPEGSFDSFTVQYKDAQGQPQVVPVDGESRTVTVPNLVPSRRYKFNLYGVWGRKRLGPISTDAVTAPASPEEEEPPSQPQLGDLTASQVTPNSIQLDWTVPEGSFDSFTVQYKDAQGQPQVVPVDGESRTVTVPNLVPSRCYKFNLYGMWKRKRLGPISTDAVTAPAPPEKEEPPSQPQLGDLTASHVTPNSIQLDWTVPEGSFDSFMVQYKDAQGQPQVVHVDGESHTVTVPNLVPSRRYKFNVYGMWGRKRLGPVSTDAITAPAPLEEEEEEEKEEEEKKPPSRPQLGDLTASDVTPNSIQLDWTVPEGNFDSFTVQYKDAQGQPQVVPVDGESRTVTVPNLVPSRRYKFNVYGMWGRKRLGPISTDAVTAPAPPEEEEEEPPSPPQLGGIKASRVTPTSVQLEWTVPEGSFDSFTVQYKDAQGQPQVVPVDGESRTVTVPNLVPSRRYKFNLYGMWKRKRLGPISITAIPAPTPPEVENEEEEKEEEPPSPPQLGDLTASHVTPNSIQLDWTIPEGSFDSFTVQYEDAQGQPQVVPVDGESRTVILPNLVPSQRYKFNLYGMWKRKHLGPVSVDAVTAPAPPEEEEDPPWHPQLGDLTASHVTPNSIQLDWTVPEGSFDSFTVQYKDAQGQPQVIPVDGESRTVTVPNLVPSRRYKFNVYGVWGRKRLGPISTDAVTAPAPPEEEEPPSPPQLGDLTASHVTPNSIQLDWTVPEGNFDSFTVQYKDAQGQPQVVPVDGESRTVTVPNLVPSRRYKFNLYGMWKRKRLGPISADAVTVPTPPEEQEEDPPWHPQLGDLTASHVTPNSIQLEWTVPEGSFDSFTVQYKDAQGQLQVIPVDGESRTVTVPNLVPSRRYKFNVYGMWGRKRLGPISTDAVTAPSPPDEPPARPQLGELTASQVTPTSVQLQWTIPVGSFDSFTVQYKDAQGQPQVVPVDGKSHTVTVPDLVPSRRYKFNLYGMWKRKRLGPISTDAVTASFPLEEEKPPSQPHLGDLTASNITSNSIQLDWTVPEGTFDSFTVQYEDEQGQPHELPVDSESRTVTVPDLVPSHLYKFNVYGMWQHKHIGLISTEAITAPAAPEEEPPSPSHLGELTVSDVTPDSVHLEWTVPKGTFDSFVVQYRDEQDQPQVVPVDGESNTVTVSGLVPSHYYKFDLYGVWRQKRLGPVSTEVVTVPRTGHLATDPRLDNFTVIHVTHNSIQLDWTVPEGSFDSFTVQYEDEQGQPQVVPVDGESRTVTVPNLVPSHRYNFSLVGVWGQNRVSPISTDAITAPAPPGEKEEEEPPSRPRLGDLTASHVTPTSVQLNWTILEGTFDFFTVQYRDAQGQPQVLRLDGRSRMVTVPDLVPSRRYKFNLFGIWQQKRVGFVSTEAITAPAPLDEKPPSRPRLGDLTASHVTPSSIQLDWTVPEGNFDSFIVQYKDAQGQPQVVPVDGGSRTVTVPNLVPSRRYKFNLYGVWGRKRLGPTSTDAVTAPAPSAMEASTPPQLGDLTAPHVTPTSVQLQWTVPEGSFDSFTVQYKDAQGQPQVVPVDGESRTVTVPNLVPSRRYKFNVYGLWGRKRLGPISTDAVTAPAPSQEEPPSQPQLGDLTASHVTPNSIQLDWTVPEGTFDSFTVQYKDAQGQPQVVPVDGESRTVTVSNLVPSQRYKFNLYGLWGRKRLGPISTDAVTAPAPSQEEPPSPPQLGDLTASHVTPNSIQLDWTVPEGSFDSFTVQYKDAQGQPQVVPVDRESRTVTVSNLVPSRRYKFNVYGMWGRKRLGPISTDAVTEEEPPFEPHLGNLTSSHVTSTSIQLNWTILEGTFDSFVVQYEDGQGQPQELPVDGVSRTVTVSNLTPSHVYKFNVYGVWGQKRLGPISTNAVTDPSSPRGLRVEEVTPRSARLRWDPPSAPPSGYVLTYGTPNGDSQTHELPPETVTHKLGELEPSGRYRVQLRVPGGGTPLEATIDTPPLPFPHPRDCAEEQQNEAEPSREALVFLGGDPARPLRVYCDMESDGGGWLVFQRRVDGGTDFWRNWDDYARGFGNVSGEFWLGNEALHELTRGGRWELRVELRAPGEAAFARYRDFAVGGAADDFRLHLGAYSGTAGDALGYHVGSPFSTRDRARPPRPCALSYTGAWWYRNCHLANLNGRYGETRGHQGIHWFPWKGFNVSIPFTEMKLRPQRD